MIAITMTTTRDSFTRDSFSKEPGWRVDRWLDRLIGKNRCGHNRIQESGFYERCPDRGDFRRGRKVGQSWTELDREMNPEPRCKTKVAPREWNIAPMHFRELL
jgi:hypothetical protein